VRKDRKTNKNIEYENKHSNNKRIIKHKNIRKNQRRRRQ
jgi:hypothetical protein